MRASKSLSAITLLTLATGCSVGSFNGSVAGTTFTPKDAVSASAHFSASQGASSDLQDMSIGVVLLTSTANTCDDMKNNVSRANEKGVFFFMMSLGDSAAQPSKGDYLQDSDALNTAMLNKTSGKFTVGEFAADDTDCQALSSLSDGAGTATAGKVTIDSADSGGTHGSYAVTFGTSDKVTGSFSASNCNNLVPSLNSLAYHLGYDVSVDSTESSQDPNKTTCKP